MKTIFVIILLFFTFSLQAQAKRFCEKNLREKNIDKINHFGVGYLAGASVNAVTYNLLSEKTTIDLRLCKAISFTLGSGTGLLIGHLKEKYDKKHTWYYNKLDRRATFLGSTFGALTVTIPISRIKK